MKTIYQKIQEAVKKNCADVHYEKSYPKDYVKLNHTNDELLEDESIDTMTPLVHAMQVILDVIKQEATTEDDLEVDFYHLPGEEAWGISIGDGR